MPPVNIGFDETSPALDDLATQLVSNLSTALREIDGLRQAAVASNPIAVILYFNAHVRLVDAVTAVDTKIAVIGTPLITVWNAKYPQETASVGADYTTMKNACIALVDAIWSILPKDASGQVLLWEARNATTRQVSSKTRILTAGELTTFNNLWITARAAVK